VGRGGGCERRREEFGWWELGGEIGEVGGVRGVERVSLEVGLRLGAYWV